MVGQEEHMDFESGWEPWEPITLTRKLKHLIPILNTFTEFSDNCPRDDWCIPNRTFVLTQSAHAGLIRS